MLTTTQPIEDAKKKGEGRKFTQTIDLIVNLQQMEFSKAENRFTEEVILEAGKGKDVVIGAIGDDMISRAKALAQVHVSDSQLDGFEKNKRSMKSLVRDVDFFIADPKVMLKVGKVLGRALGPKGKMPKAIPPQMDPAVMINRLKKTTRIRLTGSPVVQVAVGTESMKSDDLKKNIDAVLVALERKLPNGKNNIKSVFVKTTMGSPVKAEFR